MPPVLIDCPETHELVPAGVEVQSLEELEPDNLLPMCPACGQDHEWTPDDAVIVRY